MFQCFQKEFRRGWVVGDGNGVACKPTVKQGGAYIIVIPIAGVSSSGPGVIAQAFNELARGIADGGISI